MATALEFYSIFLPNINLFKMRLCDAFVEKIRGGEMLPERVVLRNRGGLESEVKVLREGGRVHFGEGWVEFVEKNGLRSGYVLIFRYDGVGTFDVKIYDYSSCEVEFCQDDAAADDEICPFGDHDEEEDDEEEEEEETEDSGDADYGYSDPRVPNCSKRGTGQRGQARQKRPYRKHNWEDSEAELLVKPGSLYFVTDTGSRKRKNQFQVTRMALRDFDVELDDKINYRDPTGSEYVGKVSRWKTGQIWISAWGIFCERNHLRDTDKCVFELEIGQGRKCSSMLVHIIRKP